MNTFERLDELLDERGISLCLFCRQSGVPYSTLDSIKRRNGQLKIDTIERICAYFDIPLYRFFMTDADGNGSGDGKAPESRFGKGA